MSTDDRELVPVYGQSGEIVTFVKKSKLEGEKHVINIDDVFNSAELAMASLRLWRSSIVNERGPEMRNTMKASATLLVSCLVDNIRGLGLVPGLEGSKQ